MFKALEGPEMDTLVAALQEVRFAPVGAAAPFGILTYRHHYHHYCYHLVVLTMAVWRQVSFSKGDSIIRQGERGDSFYILKSGTVKVCTVM